MRTSRALPVGASVRSFYSVLFYLLLSPVRSLSLPCFLFPGLNLCALHSDFPLSLSANTLPCSFFSSPSHQRWPCMIFRPPSSRLSIPLPPIPTPLFFNRPFAATSLRPLFYAGIILPHHRYPQLPQFFSSFPPSLSFILILSFSPFRPKSSPNLYYSSLTFTLASPLLDSAI